MNLAEYQRMFDAEQDHFWFRGTRGVVFDQVRGQFGRSLDVLDLGCGTGGTMSQMPAPWKTVGADFSAEALSFASRRGHARLAQASGESLPFKAASFDLVFALDVVEHCRDDAAVAGELFRLLRPTGTLVVTVPAFQVLFGKHDRALHHQRRYRSGQIERLLTRAGFSLRRLSYFNTLLFPPAALVRLAGRIAPQSDGERSDASVRLGPLNGLLYGAFAAERRLLRYLDLPWGLSILAVASRPDCPPVRPSSSAG